jgi:hypothetical protein
MQTYCKWCGQPTQGQAFCSPACKGSWVMSEAALKRKRESEDQAEAKANA